MYIDIKVNKTLFILFLFTFHNKFILMIAIYNLFIYFILRYCNLGVFGNKFFLQLIIAR